MPRIATLTLNPAIDAYAHAKKVQHTRKIRTTNDRFSPGGGGINVARILKHLGTSAEAIYLAGGATGDIFAKLLLQEGVSGHRLHISGETRVSLTVYEEETGEEFRFVPDGPTINVEEWQACLNYIANQDYDILVASGSLPPGAPADFYARLLRQLSGKHTKLILDTSGEALKLAMAEGGIWLVKPSLGEIEQLVGTDLSDEERLGQEAAKLVAQGAAELVAVTLGDKGALLAHPEGISRLAAPQVQVRSAVGAGDSFVGGMTWALAHNWPLNEAFMLGIAAGTATITVPGTGICKRNDIRCWYDQLSRSPMPLPE